MCFDKLKYGVPKDDDEGRSGGRGDGGGGGDGGTPGLPPRMTVQEEMDDIVRRLDYPPPRIFDCEKDFPPLSREPVETALVEPRETSFF